MMSRVLDDFVVSLETRLTQVRAHKSALQARKLFGQVAKMEMLEAELDATLTLFRGYAKAEPEARPVARAA